MMGKWAKRQTGKGVAGFVLQARSHPSRLSFFAYLPVCLFALGRGEVRG